MTWQLSPEELVLLVRRVFRPDPQDHRVGILLDLPGGGVKDDPAWRERRETGLAWAFILDERAAELGLDGCDLIAYPNVGAQNAELPASAWVIAGREAGRSGEILAGERPAQGQETPFEEIFERCSMLMAPTRFSTTAPLKNAARRHPFRAATMPGFTNAMIPALRLDYGVVAARVARAQQLLDAAERCEMCFDVEGQTYELVLDLRFRSAHASDGLLPRRGMAGNLPSGEAYIVPHEGEREPSLSAGVLPVQHGDEVVFYEIQNNRAVLVRKGGPVAALEAARLAAEPARGNLAELGIGVLGDMGVEPIGEVLLDEKLGIHIAFGRSDHFGGQVGPQHFSSPAQVVHIDHVYVPRLQPQVILRSAVLHMDGGAEVLLARDGELLAV